MHDTAVYRNLDGAPAGLLVHRQLRSNVLVNRGVALLVRHGDLTTGRRKRGGRRAPVL
jgi:hypothetical protein